MVGILPLTVIKNAPFLRRAVLASAVLAKAFPTEHGKVETVLGGVNRGDL
jgi:hypothetical protein